MVLMQCTYSYPATMDQSNFRLSRIRSSNCVRIRMMSGKSLVKYVKTVSLPRQGARYFATQLILNATCQLIL